MPLGHLVHIFPQIKHLNKFMTGYYNHSKIEEISPLIRMNFMVNFSSISCMSFYVEYFF